MKRSLILLLLLIVIISCGENIYGCSSAPLKERCLDYEPHSISLDGKIVKEVFPGPPNYESIQMGDKPEKVWILELKKEVCFQNGPHMNRFQLVLHPEDYEKYRSYPGKDVVVSGKAFTAHTGHHFTEVLIQVDQIR